jgi:hypothetical protein
MSTQSHDHQISTTIETIPADVYGIGIGYRNGTGVRRGVKPSRLQNTAADINGTVIRSQKQSIGTS